jgi:beta-lactamase regulating signal transducer with metallopeptidase domain
MHTLLNWLAQGTLIALVTGIALRGLGRARAADRYALCGGALLTVLLLPILPAPAFGGAPSIVAPGPVFAVPASRWTSMTVILIAWTLWCTLYGARAIAALVALRRAKRHCRPFPQAVESTLHDWNAVRESGRRTHLRISDVRAAVVLGGRSPIIGVSPTLVQGLSADDLDRIVVHEWAHVQRRDDLLNLAHLAARVIAGWHPAVWWLERQMRVEREAACDEIAVSITGRAKAYASSLTAAAGLLPVRAESAAMLGALSSRDLRARVVRILAQARLASPLLSRGVVVGAVLPLWALCMVIAGVQLVGASGWAAPRETVARAGAATTAQYEDAISLGASAEPSGTPPNSRIAAPTDVRSAAASSRADTQRSVPAELGSPAGSASGDSAAPSIPSGMGSLVEYVDPLPRINARVTLPMPAFRTAADPVRPPQAREAGSDAPWAKAADAGVAVGRGSQRAAVATAGAFSKFAKKIATSF